jgi:hypothetical protein
MPDHFHGILYVKEKLPKEWHLGRIISGWKGACSRAYTRNVNGSELTLLQGNVLSLFEKGYNDRPLVSKGQLQGWIQYLRDNPRRLWLKKYQPDMLRKVYEFEAGAKGRRFTAVGNTFFVTYPEIAQVRCHRNLSEEEIQKEVAHYLGLARSVVILVSPFISPAEKAVYEACYREKLRMIRIVSRALDGKFMYPSGRDLRGCSDGFLLVLAPYADYSDETRAVRISRATCLDMNAYAADLSTVIALTRDAHNKDPRA